MILGTLKVQAKIFVTLFFDIKLFGLLYASDKILKPLCTGVHLDFFDPF